MSLVKYRPGGLMKTYDNFFDAFFNRSIGDLVGSDMLRNQPSVNVIEHDEEFVIEVAAPGLEKKDFGIQVDNGNLVVSASKKVEKEENEERFTRREFNYTSFNRQFHLPDNVNADAISAGYSNGILSVKLPKMAEEDKPGVQKIEIA